MAESKKNPKLLTEFLKEIIKLPKEVTDALIAVAKDEDEKNVIRGYAPLLTNQFEGIASLIEETATASTLNEQSEVERFLRTASAVPLVKSAKSFFPSLGSLFGKIGLDEIIKAIKKLIDAIFDIFGGMPKWLEDLLLIIDEIISTLLGGILMKTINLFSQREQNFLNERRALALYKKAKEQSANGEDDEN